MTFFVKKCNSLISFLIYRNVNKINLKNLNKNNAHIILKIIQQLLAKASALKLKCIGGL